MTDIYAYREKGRRPLTLLVLAACIALLWIAWRQSAPWYVWIIWSVCTAFLLYLVVFNVTSALRLTSDTLELHDGNRTRTVLLKNVDHVEFQRWTDSADVTIHMKDGRRETLSPGSVPPISVFEAELASRGIRTRRH